MEFLTVEIEKPEDVNVILGQSHFIKSVEDIHETLVGAVPGEPALRVQLETVIEHFEAMLAYYGEHAGVRIARKHLGWYSAGLAGAAEFRGAVNGAVEAAAVRGLIGEFWG